MKINQGMYVGMGNTSVALLVRVESISGHTFVGHVINGAWKFVYDTQSKKMTFEPPFGKRECVDSNILFTDPLPESVGYDNYNELIHYMNEHLNRPRVVSWFLRRQANIVDAITTFYKRFKTSAQMFIRTWKNGSTDITYVDLDDDIPF